MSAGSDNLSLVLWEASLELQWTLLWHRYTAEKQQCTQNKLLKELIQALTVVNI